MTEFPADAYVDAQKNWVGERCIVIPSVKNAFNNLKFINGKRVLDVGCGSGHFSKLFLSWGAQNVVGIDNSSEMISECIKTYKGLENLRFERRAAEEMTFEEKFDVIAAFYVLQFIHDKTTLQEAISHIFQSLDTKGVFVAIVPNGRKDFHPLAEEGKKFGVAVETPTSDIEDGQVLQVNFYENNEVVEHSHVAIHFKETYEEMLKSAGFSKVEFISPIISEEGIQEFGYEFFASYLNPPKEIFIRAYKD